MHQGLFGSLQCDATLLHLIEFDFGNIRDAGIIGGGFADHASHPDPVANGRIRAIIQAHLDVILGICLGNGFQLIGLVASHEKDRNGLGGVCGVFEHQAAYTVFTFDLAHQYNPSNQGNRASGWIIVNGIEGDFHWRGCRAGVWTLGMRWLKRVRWYERYSGL